MRVTASSLLATMTGTVDRIESPGWGTGLHDPDQQHRAPLGGELPVLVVVSWRVG